MTSAITTVCGAVGTTSSQTMVVVTVFDATLSSVESRYVHVDLGHVDLSLVGCCAECPLVAFVRFSQKGVHFAPHIRDMHVASREHKAATAKAADTWKAADPRRHAAYLIFYAALRSTEFVVASCNGVQLVQWLHRHVS